MIKLMPFQETGRDFLALRQNAILADDMGLGKTYQVLEAIKKVDIQSGIVVCPQSIRRSWVKRTRGQMPLAFIKEIISSKTMPDPGAFNIINYDIAWKEPLISALAAQRWQVMVCDESHYLKNIDAKRTKKILGKGGLYSRCERRWMITGTPVLNRPIELYTVLRSLFPQQLGEKYQSYYDFAYRFCAAYQGQFGFDCSGASNLGELSEILRPLMLRRMKSDVLKDLPAVTYDKVYLDPSDKLIKLIQLEHAEYNAGETIGESSSVRQAIGVIKVSAAIKHLRNVLEEKGKVVVFIWHAAVVDGLMEEFKGQAVRYTGKENVHEKEKAVHRFQTDPAIKLFIGNVQSAGFGVDGLQDVCDTAVFVEMSYVPEVIRQCIDRLNRMGQKSPVQIQFLIAENSVDEDIIDTLSNKAKNINLIMGDRKEVDFVETRCAVCKRVTEMKKLKRVVKLTVCEACKKEMECVL
jgi:SWI/SNF-related matrix-associated actin-dependent regulator 1 of chromatin subfamily A